MKSVEKDESTKSDSKSVEDLAKNENTTNDGVKILEEVFGKSPAEVNSEDTPSVSSTEESSET